MIVPPGSRIGIVGGGQLGRMLAMAAARLGYRSYIYAPEASGPAGDVTAGWTQGSYDDSVALADFAASVDVVTYEFENVPVAPLRMLSQRLHPNLAALEVAQDRLTEKDFVARLGLRPAPYRAVDDLAGLRAAIAELGAPAILKTRRFGYDGKGQARLQSADDAEAAWEAIGGRPAVLEGFIRFDREFSVIAVRGHDGGFATWDVPDNVHENGILATSTVPAGALIAAQAAEAIEMTRAVADALDYVGVLTVEYFATAAGPVFNEMAPRVHNSGHWTIEGAVTCQFENHVRAICGLPLGSTARAAPRVEMRNLIGTQADDWAAILADPTAHLHLYGKGDPRPGRKMGHVTRLLGE
ncbi:5-(carboxyamino)imidazole ribonucleotide synthase [Sphingomonas laterariae]|uniref:N5-carboxyaminoimidazole ribonucleotide synthase n=1 Tax=Edaphosphingomonas laterariae TaxID=861865 RepID=A0A239GMP5_9SPHN|nr:5-(carboxyamino)imidazole ribonucleotide synthase [Sphingomonas laterariae]SNS70145.1 5-(carboxyamino)imidazole ribonucleotide synthase [Sphingomonas laterariae]